jgi:AAHS family 3-hydroxyphenylpropionic acid transporter
MSMDSSASATVGTAAPAVAGISTSRRSITVGLCALVAVLEGVDLQAMGVVAPRMAKELHLLPPQMGWAFSAGNIGLAIGAWLAGWAADRLGRKPLLVASIVLFGLFTIATGYVHDYEPLVAVRFVAGLGLGGALASLIAVATEVSLAGHEAFTTTLVFCGQPMGGLLLAFAMAKLDLSFRAVFVIGGVLPLAVAGAVAAWMVETYRQRAEARMPVWSALFGGTRLVATPLVWATFFPTLLVLYLILNWLPTLVVGLGFARPQASLAASVFNAGAILGALVIGRLVDRFGARWPVLFGYALLGAALVSFAAVASYPFVLAASAVVGFGLIGAQYSLYSVAAARYPLEARGAGVGAYTAAARTGSVFGPLLAGTMLGAGKTPAQVLSALVPVVIVAALSSFGLSFVRS